VVAGVKQAGPSGNGNGHKVATIKTGKWAAAAKALAERCPTYAKDNGQPDW
jgi:hypothetical protein